MAINDLNVLKDVPKDEYYTRYEDVDAELKHYVRQLAGKKIYLNCDSDKSNFVLWFKKHPELGCKVIHTSDDYRKPANLKRMADQDIIITNPPFSMIRDYLPRLINSRKRFLIIAPMLSVSYQDILPYYDNGAFHFGYNRVYNFLTPYGGGSKERSILLLAHQSEGRQAI